MLRTDGVCAESSRPVGRLQSQSLFSKRYLVCTPNDELVRQVASAKDSGQFCWFAIMEPCSLELCVSNLGSQECTEWDNVRMLDEQFVECEFQVAGGLRHCGLHDVLARALPRQVS